MQVGKFSNTQRSKSTHLVASLPPGLTKLVILGEEVVLEVCAVPLRRLFFHSCHVYASHHWHATLLSRISNSAQDSLFFFLSESPIIKARSYTATDISISLTLVIKRSLRLWLTIIVIIIFIIPAPSAFRTASHHVSHIQPVLIELLTRLCPIVSLAIPLVVPLICLLHALKHLAIGKFVIFVLCKPR